MKEILSKKESLLEACWLTSLGVSRVLLYAMCPRRTIVSSSILIHQSPYEQGEPTNFFPNFGFESYCCYICGMSHICFFPTSDRNMS